MAIAIKSTVVCVVVFVAAVGQVQAELLTFEDIPGGSEQGNSARMPEYRGFTFSSNVWWIDADTGWNVGAHSGDFGIFNNEAGAGIIEGATGEDFVFGGLWAKVWPADQESGGDDILFGTLSGFNNGVLVWTVDTGLNGSYEFYAPQPGAIDQLELGFGDFFIVDDITLNAVPEPSTLTLWSLCCGAGLCCRWWRKKTRTRNGGRRGHFQWEAGYDGRVVL